MKMKLKKLKNKIDKPKLNQVLRVKRKVSLLMCLGFGSFC